MPCYSYSIPAVNCISGSKLAAIKGSVCSNCYARKGRYLFGNVKKALASRLKSITSENWVDNMVFLIKNSGYQFFRWHDSGDLQGAWHLDKIVDIARKCPSVKFWMPTKELTMISQWKKNNGEFPKNLCVRISAPMKESQVSNKIGPSSMVIKDINSPKLQNMRPVTVCPAASTHGKCGECRACWDREVDCIAYPEH